MDYNFPLITHIDDVRNVIRGKDEFFVKDDAVNGHLIANYNVNFAETFPTVVDVETAILREIRGIAFDKVTGEIISRPYQKFFNLGEKTETFGANVDWSVPHVIMEKLDGSMVRPFNMNDNIMFGTKMGLTDVARPVTEFAKRGLSLQNDEKVRTFYIDFCHDMIKSGYTPIFEWCSRLQRIVIDYPNDMLVLTAIRNTTTGKHLTLDEIHAVADPYRVPVGKTFDLDTGDLNAFVDYVKTLQNLEGFVVRFANGHMLKIKADDYLTRHRVKDNMTFEKNVIAMIAKDNWDDALGLLAENDAKALNKFAHDMHDAINANADRLFWVAQAAHDNLNGSKKRYALEVVNTPPNEKYASILFKLWDCLDDGVEGARKLILNYVKDHTNTQNRVDETRHFINGINWKDYYTNNVD